MLSTIIGTFIGGWLLCSVIAVFAYFDTIHRDKKAKGENISYMFFMTTFIFILGPVIVGATLGEIMSKDKKPSQ
jgi:energy-coupling factor transporter transmembrane protein EcfT